MNRNGRVEASDSVTMRLRNRAKCKKTLPYMSVARNNDRIRLVERSAITSDLWLQSKNHSHMEDRRPRKSENQGSGRRPTKIEKNRKKQKKGRIEGNKFERKTRKKREKKEKKHHKKEKGQGKKENEEEKEKKSVIKQERERSGEGRQSGNELLRSLSNYVLIVGQSAHDAFPHATPN